MTSEQVFKLVQLIEDGICMKVDIDDYEEIMPKVALVLFNRYCSGLETNEGLALMKEMKELENVLGLEA
jgi:hypothetical protein